MPAPIPVYLTTPSGAPTPTTSPTPGPLDPCRAIGMVPSRYAGGCVPVNHPDAK
jgi:hypothetical protein